MYLSTVFTLAASLAPALVTAAPFKFPLPDGFPRPNPEQLLAIEKAAGGFLGTGPGNELKLTPAAISSLELLTNNEYFEVALFSQLLSNITDNVPGYGADSIAPLDRDQVIKAITAIKNQEEVHALGANAILISAKQPPIAPCQYVFPASSFKDAILFAQIVTDLALATVPEVQLLFALDGGDEPPNVLLLGSILGQEAQQDGFFRYAQKKTPSAAPFLTGGTSSFAFSALKRFIVPDSCPKPLSTINLRSFKDLDVVTKPEAKNMTLKFSVDGPIDPDKQSLVYLTGQNLPLTVPILRTHVRRGTQNTFFTAEFPFLAGFSNGLTIATVVNGKDSKFSTPKDVAAATVYGPGLIEVN